MTDFNKIKEAAEEIKLDDLQKQRILEACKGKKRRKVNYTAIVSIAALFIITLAVFSPGFLMRAEKAADCMGNEAAVEDFFAADQEMQNASGLLSDKAYSENGDADLNYTVNECTQCIFDADGFRNIYSTIPQSFIKLVDCSEFNEWATSVSADNGMAIVQFKEHFGIPKEAFDEANRNYAKYIYETYGILPLYKASYPEHEIYEIFDTEMIYSANRESIDKYYKSIEFKGAGAHSMPAEIIVPEEYYK